MYATSRYTFGRFSRERVTALDGSLSLFPFSLDIPYLKMRVAISSKYSAIILGHMNSIEYEEREVTKNQYILFLNFKYTYVTIFYKRSVASATVLFSFAQEIVGILYAAFLNCPLTPTVPYARKM